MPEQRQGGITPLYAAPELLRGTVSRHCDQYSLAIVYQQLLTGTVPFWCQNMYQLMMLHLTAEPNWDAFADRGSAGRRPRVVQTPEDRFPSCLDFLQALVCGQSGEQARPAASRLGGEKVGVGPASRGANGQDASAEPADARTSAQENAAGRSIRHGADQAGQRAQTPPGGVLPKVPRACFACQGRDRRTGPRMPVSARRRPASPCPAIAFFTASARRRWATSGKWRTSKGDSAVPCVCTISSSRIRP